MARINNPSVVTSNLLLNVDFKNPKLFSSTLGTNLVQNSNYNASTWGVYLTSISTNIDSPDGSNTAVRISTIVRTGTYTLTTNVATVTITNHGLTSGIHYFDFTSGTGVDGQYTITVVDANTLTIPVTAADGSGNVTLYVRSGLRVGFNSFTPNGTDTYTISFWVRLISSNFILGGIAGCGLHDSTPSLNYTSQLVANKWVQIVLSGVPTATAKTFFDLLDDCFGTVVMDFWGLKIENTTSDNTPMPVVETVGRSTFNLYRPVYATLSDSDVTFTRTATNKWGGTIFSTMTGSLTSQNFLYNNHSWEIWFKINDRTAGNYDATEAFSSLSNYRGYHSGFHYNSSSLTYIMWDNAGPNSFAPCSWTLGASGAQINEGSWYQVVVTRSGNVFTPYVNGAQLGTGSTLAFTAYSGVTNDLHIGGMVKAAAGASSYAYYPKCTIANMKMYNKALTAAEVLQNFNALRGRFGI